MPSISDLLLKAKSLATQDVVVRTLKTIGAVFATEGALYTTVIPNPPSTGASAALATGAGAVTLVLNLALAWATKAKSAKLDQLAAAIDKLVDARLKEQGQADPS